MRNRRHIGATIFLSLATFLAIAQKERPPNVLMICVDDLLPALGCYGNEEVYTPHINLLAASSALFTRQYVTVPTCGASRYSLLRSKLPRSRAELGNNIANVLSNGKKEQSANPETFIEQFRRNGYHTVGIGKISHSPDGYIYPYAGPKSSRKELPNSWDEFVFNPGKWGQGWNAFFAYADGESRTTKNGQVRPYEAADVTDEGYPDGLTAALAVGKLKELAERNQPFFLGVGFFKPHLPFNAPQKYWDMYQEEQLSLTPVPDLPLHVHRASLHQSAEFNQYKLGEEKASLDRPLSDAYSRRLIHGYYACISYIDQQIGKLLQALKTNGLDKNTIVILWSDHGWHLGDYHVWGKHTLFDRSLRSVLMIKTPAMKRGKKIDRVVSSIDIAPTLLDLCHLPELPQADGRSMVSLLKDKNTKEWQDVAYSYFRNGVTMVTPRYRLTHYFRTETPVTELYDHDKDPLETTNIAPSNPDLIRQLDQLWQKGNTGLFE
ncbi:sulfatase [Sphingobacterium sp. SGG-5]|uniref:sulfatase n=1 Tax=Sphingobacterium sp. SGG-5 TaxID=2710881 RepID=UPI0013EE3EBE|nr:sulfatase [Sphingobacterium sp. SGG-5]NGM61538.1 sulfatase [Sphingobacterium sp. SGG-5]